MTLSETLRSLAGAALLLRGDTRGLDWIDQSVPGAWHSFWAAAVVAPLLLIIDVMRLPGLPDVPAARILLGEAFLYVIRWTAFVVMIAPLLPAIARGAPFSRFVALYNWASAVLVIVLFPLVVVQLLGLVGPEGRDFLSLAMIAGSLAFYWVLFRAALKVDTLTALGLAFFEFILGITIQVMGDVAIFGPGR